MGSAMAVDCQRRVMVKKAAAIVLFMRGIRAEGLCDDGVGK